MRSQKAKLSLSILAISTSILLSNIFNQYAQAYSLKSEKNIEQLTYEVEYGDTLWSIANKFTEDDPRDMVVKIMKINKLRGDLIRPGQVLTIEK